MEIPRHWRLKQQRYNLVGEVCPHCDHKMFPPRDVCTNCHGEAKDLYTFKGKGEIYSYTTVYEAPAEHDKGTPYTVALVKLDEGPIVTAQLTDLEMQTQTEIIDGEEREVENPKVEIGMPVEMVTRKLSEDGELGLINYGYKFRPPVEVSSSSK